MSTSSERVDKQWQKKGLEAYSTGAILGTLQHYGVALDEEGFRAAAAERFPAQLALDWLAGWKGTGQFANFPYVAAQELTRRLFPDRVMPLSLSKTLAELLESLAAKQQGAGASDLDARFGAVEAMLEKLPTAEEARRGFVDEALLQLGEKNVRVMDEIAEAVARAGHLEDAKRFAELEEKLLPERAGIATALVQSVAGDRDGAVQKLKAAGEEAGRPVETKVMAVDALTNLNALDEALEIGKAALDTAEATEEHHAAMALCDMVGRILERQGRRDDLAANRERAKRIAAAHHQAHPHHRH